MIHRLKRYITSQETGDRLFHLYRKLDSSKRKSYPNNDWKKHWKFEQFSTRAFAANERNNHRCYYSDQDHWNDECKQCGDIKTRTRKAKGYCFISLKKGHILKDCKSTKPSIYCRKSGNRHWSRCPKQFVSKEELSATSIEVKESNLLLLVSKLWCKELWLTLCVWWIMMKSAKQRPDYF